MALPPFEATSSQEAECCHLGRPIFESLDHPAIFRFRKDYQQHRLGHAKGAKGEVGEALREVQEQQQQHGGAGQQHHAAPPLPEGISEEDAESLLSPFGAYEADSPFYRDEQLLLQIARWRMAYQRFRTGGARGAAGDLEEIARGLSLKALKLLPVVQLAEVLKRDKQPKAPELQLPSPHLHFGGGKLGFGLVLQAMLRAQMKDLILLQRPSEDFKPLLEAEKRESVPVFVNGEKVCSLRVYVHPKEIEDLIETLKTKAHHASLSAGETARHFVLTSDSRIILELTKIAGSLSCSLGPALKTALGPLLQQLPDTPEEERVILYACENDHGAVARLKEDLKNKLLLLPCMVDRICASRHIFSDKIEVVAEPYEGEIVVLDRPETAPPPPFGGSNVHAPQLQASAHYLCQRKIGLVNGLHTTLAFLTACKYKKELLQAIKQTTKPKTNNLQSSPSQKALDAAAAEPLLAALRELSLLKETEMNEKQRNIMWGWLAARCLHLLWEHDKEVIKRTHNLQTDEEVVVMLLDYGVKTLKRFSTVEDTAGRVLGGGVVNRFHTRLLTIYRFLEEHIFGSVPLAANLLQHANISAFQMIDEVRRLVDDSRVFVEPA